MAYQFPFERCRKQGVILTCFVDGRKRFRTAPVVGRDDSNLFRGEQEHRDDRASAFRPFLMLGPADQPGDNPHLQSAD